MLYVRAGNTSRALSVREAVEGEAHQSANRWFVYYLTLHVQLAGIGYVYGLPFDVELAPGVVVQPDVIVVLNENQGVITPSHIVGTPDLLIEISSPGTVGYDRRAKQDAYAGQECRNTGLRTRAPTRSR